MSYAGASRGIIRTALIGTGMQSLHGRSKVGWCKLFNQNVSNLILDWQVLDFIQSQCTEAMTLWNYTKTVKSQYKYFDADVT